MWRHRAFIALYLIWGSTYLAIRIGVESWPPLLMAGVRFVVAGALMYGFLRWRGAPNPTWQEWKSAAAIGFLLRFLRAGSFAPFAVYRLLLAGLVAGLLAFRG